jgi:hypothetical protein
MSSFGFGLSPLIFDTASLILSPVLFSSPHPTNISSIDIIAILIFIIFLIEPSENIDSYSEGSFKLF